MAARRAAVLGSPVAHSLSPALHSAAYRALGLDGWSYEAIECDEQRLPGLLASLGPDWAGLSLTMPLKRAVLPLLDLAQPLVTRVGAANTVLLRGNRRVGHNTDVPGMARAMRGARVTP
jgi:shikimate 5-dehydrogenase